MVSHYYEVISYSGPSFYFCISTESSVIPHIHREIEIGVLIREKHRFSTGGTEDEIEEGGMWVTNSCQCHDSISPMDNQPYITMVFQIAPSFFSKYYPEMSRIKFEQNFLNADTIGYENHKELLQLFLEAAKIYYKKEEHYELKCASWINLLFAKLLKVVPHHVMLEQEIQSERNRADRMQRVINYIEENCDRKLLLSEIAEKEHLSMHHLSHFFSDSLGMSFQDYLLRVRVQRAQEMLTRTNLPVVDVSISCGFSSVKYLNKGFQEIYGMKPVEFRRILGNKKSQEKAFMKVKREETLKEPESGMCETNVLTKKCRRMFASGGRGVPGYTGFHAAIYTPEDSLKLLEAFEMNHNLE